MTKQTENLVSAIRLLTYEEKVKVLDALVSELDKRDVKVDQIWVTEARKRWDAYKRGEVGTISYSELMARYSR